MMTDAIADMLTRIRNANRNESPGVDMPCTKVKVQIAQVLKDEGFVLDYQVGKMAAGDDGVVAFQPSTDAQEPKRILRIFLKYGPEGERVIRSIRRKSRPGLRLYKGFADLRKVLDGLGIAILSTNKGVMSDRQAKAQRLGGELLCEVW